MSGPTFLGVTFMWWALFSSFAFIAVIFVVAFWIDGISDRRDRERRGLAAVTIWPLPMATTRQRRAWRRERRAKNAAHRSRWS